MLAIPDHPTLIAGDVMRFREAAGAASKPGAIEVHIIRPGRGSSGYYTPDVLKKACEAGVYPQGMLMHWDHPTPKQEEDQPARVVGTIAAVLAEKAQYRDEGDPQAWDGPGPYALADVRPKFQEDLKWLSGKIGVSHYVDGRDTKNVECPDGKKGNLITELVSSPFNSVDFVTIPGAGGHSKFNEIRMREAAYPWDQCISDQMAKYGDEDTAKKVCAAIKNGTVQHAVDTGIAPNIKEACDMVASGTLKVSQENKTRKKMADNTKQVSIRLSELMTSDPEVVAEVRKQERESLKIDALNDDQKSKMKEAATRITALESENKTLKGRLAEGKAREFVAAEVAKAKLPETAGKNLIESLIKTVPLAEDGTIDTVKFGVTVTEVIKGKQDEIAAILKESGHSGIHDNGGTGAGSPGEVLKAREEYRDSLVENNGKTREEANRIAGIEVKA